MFRHSDGAMRILDELHRERLDYESEYVPLADAIQTLSAYEDTCMTPEEINQLADKLDAAMPYKVHFEDLTKGQKLSEALGYFRWLVLAAQNERCVVLPCKRGDKLFVRTSDSLNGIEETYCKRITVVNRECGPCVKIITPCTCDDWGSSYRTFYPEDFGETVFLTREEVEMVIGGTKK